MVASSPVCHCSERKRKKIECVGEEQGTGPVGPSLTVCTFTGWNPLSLTAHLTDSNAVWDGYVPFWVQSILRNQNSNQISQKTFKRNQLYDLVYLFSK